METIYEKTPQQIEQLRLEPARLAAHEAMPRPRYIVGALSARFASLSDAVLSKILQITPDVFRMQLRKARSHGAAYLTRDRDRHLVGLTAITSLIRADQSALRKNLVVPNDLLRFTRRLSEHIVIAAFVHGYADGDRLHIAEPIDAAGWASLDDIRHWQTSPPASFRTKLGVTFVPCTKIRPMETLGDWVVLGHQATATHETPPGRSTRRLRWDGTRDESRCAI